MFSSLFVDPIRALVFAAAHLFGGSVGGGILAVSFGLRLAFMPLTLRLARRAAVQRRILDGLKPELAAIQKRYADQPKKLFAKTQALHQRDGYRQIDPQAVLGSLARWPALAGMYGALRSMRLGSFGWIADLARPNVGLAMLVAAASGLAAWVSGQGGESRALTASTMIASAISLVFLWHLSSAIALSWSANVAGDVIQGIVLIRERRQPKTV
jgi:membrane protein insertase Oxa1/YidC/SpoIIIJ